MPILAKSLPSERNLVNVTELSCMTGQPGKRVSYNIPGHWHAVNFCCYRNFRLLRSEDLIRIFLSSLDIARTKHHFAVWAYCVMPEHVHLMLYPLEEVYSMEKIVGSIKQSSALRCLGWLRRNRPEVMVRLREVEKSGLVRHRFWQEGPGYDRNLYRGDATWREIAYIHGNPVAAGLCETTTDWEWSSARWYEGLRPVPFRVDRCPVDHPDNFKGICSFPLD